jgi:hypothetical protein
MCRRLLTDVDQGEVEDYYHSVVVDRTPSPTYRRHDRMSNLRRYLKPKDQDKDKTVKAAAPDTTKAQQKVDNPVVATQQQSSLSFPLCRADEILLGRPGGQFYIPIKCIRGEFEHATIWKRKIHGIEQRTTFDRTLVPSEGPLLHPHIQRYDEGTFVVTQ